jgi:hypothetical protein
MHVRVHVHVHAHAHSSCAGATPLRRTPLIIMMMPAALMMTMPSFCARV